MRVLILIMGCHVECVCKNSLQTFLELILQSYTFAFRCFFHVGSMEFYCVNTCTGHSMLCLLIVVGTEILCPLWSWYWSVHFFFEREFWLSLCSVPDESHMLQSGWIHEGSWLDPFKTCKQLRMCWMWHTWMNDWRKRKRSPKLSKYIFDGWVILIEMI